VDRFVASMAEGDKVLWDVPPTVGPVGEMMELEAVLAPGPADLTLVTVSIEDRLPDRRGNVLGIFLREMILQLGREFCHQLTSGVTAASSS
jgi:hypothetical protein